MNGEKIVQDNPDREQFNFITTDAICLTNYDNWSKETYPELEVGKKYVLEFCIISRNWSCVGLKEFPEKRYNLPLFRFEENGVEVDLLNAEVLSMIKLSAYMNHYGYSGSERMFVYETITNKRIEELMKEFPHIPIMNPYVKISDLVDFNTLEKREWEWKYSDRFLRIYFNS